MSIVEEVPNGGSKQHFVCEQRLEIGSLFEPFMPGYARTAFRAEKESHVLLSEAGMLSMSADIIWEWRAWHMIPRNFETDGGV